MSLILEALRKSEAERQRAQAPGLHAPAPVHRPPAARPGWGPWVAAGLGVALLAGTWWVNRPAPPPVPAPAPTVAETPPSRPESARPAAPVVLEPSAPVASAPTADPPVPVPAEPTPVPPPPIRADAAAAPVVATEPLVAATPAPAPAPSSSAPEALPGLASLSTAERAALPPLKVSMHVWHADPARRFAIVDGQRVGEGGLLGGGTVVEIRPDGVVLELQGRQLLLARP